MNTSINFRFLGRPQNVFQHIFKKKKKSIKNAPPLKMTSKIKSNYSFFVMLSTQDSEYWIGFSKLFWEYGKLDPIFQVAKMVSFCVFFSTF